MLNLTKPRFSVFFFIFVNFVNKVVEKSVYKFYVLCSKYIDENNICLFELHNFGCFRAVSLYNFLHIYTELFLYSFSNIVSLIFKTVSKPLWLPWDWSSNRLCMAVNVYVFLN